MSGLGWTTRVVGELLVASCHAWGLVGAESTGGSLNHVYSCLSCALDDAVMSMSTQSPLKGSFTTPGSVHATFLHNLAQSLFFSEHPRHLLSIVNELSYCVHYVVIMYHLGYLLPAPGSVQPAGGCILSRLQNTGHMLTVRYHWLH